MSDLTEPQSVGEETAAGVFFLIYTVIAIILMIGHFMKARKDLSNNNITDDKRIIIQLKTLGVFGFGFAVLIACFNRNFYLPSFGGCYVSQSLSVIAWKIGLGSQYLCYVCYLYRCYPAEPIGYKVSTLLKAGVVIIIFAVTAVVFPICVMHYDGVSVPDNDGKFPFNCYFRLKTDALALLLGVSIICWDLFVAVSCMVAFHVPFNKLIKLVKDKISDEELYELKGYKKCLYDGYKYKMITSVSSCTQIFWILLALSGSETLSAIFAGYSWITSIICLMLMTPYYPKDKWFKTLCCLCIVLDKCGKKNDASKVLNVGPSAENQKEKYDVSTLKKYFDGATGDNAIRSFFEKYAENHQEKKENEMENVSGGGSGGNDGADNNNPTDIIHA